MGPSLGNERAQSATEIPRAGRRNLGWPRRAAAMARSAAQAGPQDRGLCHRQVGGRAKTRRREKVPPQEVVLAPRAVFPGECAPSGVGFASLFLAIAVKSGFALLHAQVCGGATCARASAVRAHFPLLAAPSKHAHTANGEDRFSTSPPRLVASCLRIVLPACAGKLPISL